MKLTLNMTYRQEQKRIRKILEREEEEFEDEEVIIEEEEDEDEELNNVDGT